MGKLYKLDRTGHGEVAVWGPDAVSREAGAAAFKLLGERGFTMFDPAKSEEEGKLDEFDPNAGEIIAVPQMVGG